MKIKSIIVNIVAEENGESHVAGSYVLNVTKDDVERMICHAESYILKSDQDIKASEIFHVAAFNVCRYWQLLTRQVCQRLIALNDCDGEHGATESDDAGDALTEVMHCDPNGNMVSSPVDKAWGEAIADLPDMPDCDGDCENCPLWSDEDDECQIGKIPPKDQSRLDFLSGD